jgi:uncharacterized membrane protein (DUF4010 family)
VLLRWLGSAVGLPVAGLLSGFVSSTATIGVMGARSREMPGLRPRAAAAAVLSTVATFVQMGLVLALTHGPVLRQLLAPLLAGGAAALAVGLVVVWRGRGDAAAGEVDAGAAAFSVRGALLLGATIATVQLVAAALQAWLGPRGLLLAGAVAGVADTHAPAVSFASLAADGSIAVAQAEWPILLALASNTVSKAVVALLAGGRAFARPVIAGLALVLACTWGVALWAR